MHRAANLESARVERLLIAREVAPGPSLQTGDRLSRAEFERACWTGTSTGSCCEGRYGRLSRDESGVYRSEVFPGLWLDAPALARGDRARVLEVARQGLASAEHEELVRRLAG